MHQHYPLEIYVGLEGNFRMNFGDGWAEYRAVIIDSDKPHEFDGSGGWHALLLIDPVTDAGKYLRTTILYGNNFRELDVQLLNPFIKVLFGYRERAYPCIEAELLFNSILSAFSDNATCVDPLNQRIIEIIKILRGLPEKRISAKDLAELIKISEYKFNFYFKLAKKYQEFSQG